jgi:transposase
MRVTLTTREQTRLMVLNKVNRGEIVGREGAGLLGLSLRHVRRLLAAYRREGAAALAHGNRGRRPQHALEGGLKSRVLELARGKYMGCNTQHFTELLAEREGITLSRSSVRRVLLNAGIARPRKRRPPRHRRRRDRHSQEGMLLQIDGSHHDWLEGRGPRLTLIGAVDDATSRVCAALFRQQEDAVGYFLLLRQIVSTSGIPLALYHDGHATFARHDHEPESLEEQLQGRRHDTQFGRLMAELGIRSIRSRSPQGRGRIERTWGTFQDRLVSELRLARASTLEEANAVLSGYVARHNERFAVPAAEPGTAFRQPQASFSLDETFCFKHCRVAGADNVVRFGPHRLQIMPSNGRSSYARARVEIRQGLEGSLSVHYQGHRLIARPAPLEAPKLRGRAVTTEARPRRYARPAPDHPWRGIYRVHIDRG